MLNKQYIRSIGIWVVAIVLCLPISLNAQKNEDPVKILFVGNSFTYFWNMPQLVEAMSETQGVTIDARQSTVGGSNLEQHWKSEKGTITRKLLEDNQWDYVVFGDHSLSTIEAPERFMEYGTKFADFVRSKGAEPIFYMTWAYHSNPLMQETITKGYMDLATKLNAKVLPVGPVYMKARTLRPDLDLYFDDKHPSSDGTYLIALTITKLLSGKSIMDVPDRLITEDRKGEKLYLSFVLPTTGKFLRQLVDEMNFEPYKTQKWK
ncbi:DUF4886 domain-containing protein [Flagellimonas profundi]|uniref:SGNH/GDSL hydrolase family protein n=1 Tax=Flagellimonas profundi TaxID=2915620 RepID=A0ABS3FJT3_9FLAO|nr:DUF4886 domain-containing protein [Allomuricauda profundi]MBO0343473.1 hypothetical protein [Allomuricauda profundi]